MSDGLFDLSSGAAPDGAPPAGAPLAVRMRPESLDEVVGQEHLLGPGSPLRRLVDGSGAASVILYGPPGTGKTTLASLISGATGRRFEALSALSAGVKEVRAVIEGARTAAAYGDQTVLFIDEVHRFSKTQQDALLAAVENRVVLLVAATTENPSFSVVAPLLSRSLILQLQPLTADAVRTVVQRAVADPRGLAGADVDDDAVDLLVKLSAGDARRALTALEVAAETAGEERVTVEVVEQSLDQAAVRYDREFVRLGFRDIASDTNERTLIFGLLPKNVGAGNTVHLNAPKVYLRDAEGGVTTQATSPLRLLFALAWFNSLPVDWLARFMIQIHANKTQEIEEVTAGNIAATGGMAKLLKENEFATQFHEGEKTNVHISLVAQRAILVVLFRNRRTINVGDLDTMKG